MKKRVLIIHNRAYHASGPETYIQNMSKHYLVDIYSFKYENKNEFPEVVVERPLPLGDLSVYNISKQKLTVVEKLRIGFAAFFNYEAFYKLFKLLKRHRYEFVIIMQYFGKLSPSVVLACRIANVKIFIRQSDYGLICARNTLLRNNTYCDQCTVSSLKLLSNRCSGSLLRSLYFFLLMWQNKIVIKICNPTLVWTNKFALSVANRSVFVKNLNNKLNYTFIDAFEASDVVKTNTFVSAGRVAADKGVARLINAFSSSDGNLLIVGKVDVSYMSEIQALLEDKGKYIRLTGAVPHNDMENIYNKAKFVIITSQWVDNLPNTLVESYARGIPCITPSFGSFVEFIIDESLTFHDDKSLGDALKFAANIADDDYLVLRDAAIEIARDRFDFNKHRLMYEC